MIENILKKNRKGYKRKLEMSPKKYKLPTTVTKGEETSTMMLFNESLSRDGS